MTLAEIITAIAQHVLLLAFISLAMNAGGSFILAARSFDANRVKYGFSALLGTVVWALAAAGVTAVLQKWGGPVWFLEMFK